MKKLLIFGVILASLCILVGYTALLKLVGMEVAFILGFSFSIVFLIGSGIVSYLARKRRGKEKCVLTTLQIFTIGVFLAVVALFIPMYSLTYNFGDYRAYLRPALVAIHHAFRVFILDGEFDAVKDGVRYLGSTFHWIYSLYAAFLFVIAPFLTFSNVLSLFNNVRNELRYILIRRRPIYVFSELNERSIVLAKDLLNNWRKQKKDKNSKDRLPKPAIVFTDVFVKKDEEEDYELLLKANDLNSICLKKDVTRLKLWDKKPNIEIFFIGVREDENVSQAHSITSDLNDYSVNRKQKQNVKLFVFASGKENGYVIDSFDYDNLLAGAAKKDFGLDTFKIRRIDCIRQLVWNTVPGMPLLNKKNNGVLSVMIAGLGSYGMEFFKMLLWYCQTEQYRLEINVFDKKNDSSSNASLESIISRQCPELMEKNPCFVDDDARYSIKCYDMDFETDCFEKLLKKEARIKRTDIVIVALGNDNSNIETAVYLRELFDREKGIKATEKTELQEELPQIYAVVYDSTKSGTVRGDGVNFLKNHKKIPYHINFIGALETQYRYENLFDIKLEREAYKYHIGWVEIDTGWVETDEKIKQKVRHRVKKDEYRLGKGKEISEKSLETQSKSGELTLELLEEYYERGKVSMDTLNTIHSKGILSDELYNNIKEYIEKYEETLNKLLGERTKYEQFEYYRLSSIARALYEKYVAVNNNNHRKLEHARWNAYMRTLGFSFGERADRALKHYDLVPWHVILERNDGNAEKDDCFDLDEDTDDLEKKAPCIFEKIKKIILLIISRRKR